MELTIHGTERIQERTKMSVMEVRELLVNNVAVSLGLKGVREYLLFFSPADNTTKIAVVDKNRRSLVSVLEKHYRLPAGVSKVTSGKAKAARKKYGRFLLRHVPPVNRNKRAVRVVLEVRVKRKLIFKHELGSAQWGQVSNHERVLKFLKNEFETLVPLAETYRRDKEPSVSYSYQVWTLDELSKNVAQRYKFSHEALCTHLGISNS
jgi:hypothetical protein